MPDFSGKATPLTADGVTAFANATNAGAAEMWAVLSVETSGCGFLPDKRPKILFERHIFHALTKGIYDQSHPDISQPSAGGYGLSGANQYNRLAEALTFDRQNALKSASWGLGQIMGFNSSLAGFADVEAMVDAFTISEDNHLAAMAAFLGASRLAGPLSQHKWTDFALGYNGPDYAQHNYDGLLEQFYGRYAAGALPDLTVRTVQMLLTYAGFDPKGIDGILGPNTRTAIRNFQSHKHLNQTGEIDDALLAALQI